MTIPVTKRRENTRARLLDAAAEVFAEVGLEGASVEAICERAGFTRGAFYSNFDSKDELFLQLSAAVAERRITMVRARIDEFVGSGVLSGDANPIDLVQRVMESGEDDRLSVLLMSEIRIRALRDAAFGAAYLVQESAMITSIEGIIQGIVDSGLFALRVDVATAAQMLMVQWEGCMGRGVISGYDGEQLHRVGAEALGRLVELIIAPAQG
ncbi:TetR family transcriptional regulator [Microbacterium sp. CH12i]|uniref:TetR/AcrR family transcriptional regulator n=1 Tax=Microbacterium sp. CH12i TaxID=1479651 RepID=UPI0004613A58|nr:TetR/AcrR family transcriptional regulator [Microbacterium sp. CH12i]KDA04945.1 TetR family transcriptional regulator [Microbacterium sp. CH12i]